MVHFYKEGFYTECGDRYKILYSPVVNKDGTIDLVESGKEDFQEYIQSFKDEVDINVLISRFVNGDVNALNSRQGVYGDFTDMPKTYAEFLQMQIDQQKVFDHLPKEVKQRFDNDVNQYIAKAGSVEWFEKLGIDLESKSVEEKVDEVKE